MIRVVESGPPRGGGQGGTMTPGPTVFRGPMSSRRGPSKLHWVINKRAIEIARVGLFFLWRPFFFRRSHHIWDQTAAFSLSVLDFTKPGAHPIWGGPSHHIWAREGTHHIIFEIERGPIQFEGAHPCLSCPRAHVRLSAPLSGMVMYCTSVQCTHTTYFIFACDDRGLKVTQGLKQR